MLANILRKTRTLDQIQSTFTEAVDDLKNLRQRNADVVEHNNQAIDRLSQRNEELAAENARAEKFQQNLENLLV